MQDRGNLGSTANRADGIRELSKARCVREREAPSQENHNRKKLSRARINPGMRIRAQRNQSLSKATKKAEGRNHQRRDSLESERCLPRVRCQIGIHQKVGLILKKCVLPWDPKPKRKNPQCA